MILAMVNITVDDTPISLRERFSLWWKYECRSLRKIRDAWYWIRTHTYNRYHMVDVRNKRNGYSWGWLDVSEKLLFANFALLVDYVENEKPFLRIDWSWNEDLVFCAKEIKNLYWWWKVDRKRQHDAYDAMSSQAYDGVFSVYANELPELRELRDKCHKEEERLQEVDTQNLIRLIKIRGCLWT